MMNKFFNKPEKETVITFCIILIAIAAMVASYFPFFESILKSLIPESSANRGQLGDFFGGILNPLMAFLALIWLMRSVKIQKEELRETRLALEDGAQAQLKQVQLSALTALSSSIAMDIDLQRSELSFLCDQLNRFDGRSIRDFRGEIISLSEVKTNINSINNKITERLLEHTKCELEIKILLETTKLRTEI